MLCSGGKTKLLIVCNKETREKLKHANKVVRVVVDGKVVEESKDEKLLGIVLSNNMSWSTNLYGNNKQGDDKIKGLVPQLSQRIGILKQLSKIVSRKQMKIFVAGIFTSKLVYGIQLFPIFKLSGY